MDLASYRTRPVHTRDITVATYPAGRDAVMVEGRLTDERRSGIFSITTGEEIPPGIVHDMVLRLLVTGPRLIIEDLEVEQVRLPRDVCRETVESLRPLIGQSISTGFTSHVKKTFGGPRGCTHLNALLIAMAPAAVQGFWTHVAGRPISRSEASRFMDSRLLIDSCWVWRRGGPLDEEVRAILADSFGNGARDGKGEG
ncbi:MAG TPA: DUF2889 domain-containing protein [Deltaproteobacteria bacterium]|nr:DUF2889 domain-containing protein [Deltaproteobacteria bacterium]